MCLYVISNITETVVNGRDLGIGGYLDVGLIDTMQGSDRQFYRRIRIFRYRVSFLLKIAGKAGSSAGLSHAEKLRTEIF